jgi:hypothetical protein
MTNSRTSSRVRGRTAGAAVYVYAWGATPTERARSVRFQRMWCRRRADELGVSIASEYQDSVESGRQFPALRRLLESRRTQIAPVDVIATPDTARTVGLSYQVG